MATKAQKEWAEIFFKENPQVEELYLNKQGEFFTNKNYVENSRQKGKNGDLEPYETLKREVRKSLTDHKKQLENNEAQQTSEGA